MPRLLHLNGPPGIGKSTLARRYGADHRGTLVCEIDTLRTMVSGWADDVADVGPRVRTGALAMITAYLREGGDVVVPQLVAVADQLARFASAAGEAGAGYVHVLLTAPHEEVVRRFRRRDDHIWQEQAARVVDAEGGDEVLRTWAERLGHLDGVRLHAADPDTTYAALLDALGESPRAGSGPT